MQVQRRIAQARENAAHQVEADVGRRAAESGPQQPRHRRPEGQGAERVHDRVDPGAVQEHHRQQVAQTATVEVGRREAVGQRQRLPAEHQLDRVAAEDGDDHGQGGPGRVEQRLASRSDRKLVVHPLYPLGAQRSRHLGPHGRGSMAQDDFPATPGRA